MTDTDYDKSPYESFPVPASHPQRLLCVSQLFGLDVPDSEKFSYLEIGCALGGNIIPLAMEYPDAEFVGIDYAQTQINMGLDVVEHLELTNIQLMTKDIMTLDESLGKFDFIVAHGIYSWVPGEVRDKLLEVSRNLLKPNGVAYISYNVYPGWKARSTLRDLLLYRLRGCTDLTERLKKTREELKVLQESFTGNVNVNSASINAYSALMLEEVKLASMASDSLLTHEYLATINTPVYFHQFTTHIEEYNLQYVADANFCSMPVSNLTNSGDNNLSIDAERFIDLQQNADFLYNIPFKCSLMTHQARNVAKIVHLEVYTQLYFSLKTRPLYTVTNLQAGVSLDFAFVGEKRYSSNEPLTKLVLGELASHWPNALYFEDLVKLAASKLRINTSEPEFEATLSKVFHKLYALDFLSVFHKKLNLVSKVSDKPEVSKLVRYQAGRQRWVTNQHHERRELDDFCRQLLMLLDGTRTKKELQLALVDVVIRGDLPLHDDKGNYVMNKTVIENTVKGVLDNALKLLASHALLIR